MMMSKHEHTTQHTATKTNAIQTVRGGAIAGILGDAKYLNNVLIASD